MANIFISHSSKDNKLIKDIFNDLSKISKSIFLDYDAQNGIKGGDDWEKTLYKRVKKARIMIVALSPNWLDSQWCYKEYCIARVLRKKIIPVVIEKDSRVFEWDGKDIQHYDTTIDPEALEKLKKRIEELTFHDVTKLYDIKDIKSPYPGLRSFDKNEAGIFYGRNDEILDVIDTLNALADSGEQKFINIVGASGVGKSSFLKAGVLPLLELLHRENWYVLPTFRAKQEILLNLAKALSFFGYRASEVLDAIKGEGYRAFFDKLELEIFEQQNESNQKILLPIDQAEEILNSESQEEKEQFFKIVQYLVEKKANFFIVWTLRSDQLNVYQAQKALEFLRDKERVYILNPIASKELQNIIQEPAFVNDVMVKDDVVEAIKEDIKTTTSLPLLAYLLQILYKNITLQQQKSITIDNYKALAKDGKNPIENIINKEADEIYANHKNKKEIEELFVNHLVKINQDESFSKRSEKLNNFPRTLHALVDRFVQKRLLMKDTDKEGQITVEIVHEAMLNSWNTLQEWLNTQKEFLLLKAQLAISMRGWGGLEKKEIPLLTGLQLQKAIEYRDRLKDKEELAYVQSSIKRDEILKRRKFLTVSGSFVAISALGGVSFWKWGEAKKQTALAQKKETLAKKRLEISEHNIGLALVEKANLAVERKEISKAHLFAFSALLKIDDKYDVTNAQANAKSILMSYDNRAIATIEGHKDFIDSVAYSSDGKYIVLGSWDKTIKIWDSKNFREIAILKGHEGFVQSVTYSPDDKYIASGSSDKTIKIWNANTFKEVATLIGHKSGVMSIAYSPCGKYIASGSGDKTIKIWNADNFKEIITLIASKSDIRSIAYSPDGKYFVSGSWTGILKIWDANSFKELATLKKHKHLVFSVAYSPDGKYIASASGDNTIKIWNTKTYKEFFTLKGHKDSVSSVVYSKDGKFIVSGSWDKTIKIWDAKSYKVIATYSLSNIASLAYSPDNNSIVTGTNNGIIRIWNMGKFKEIGNLKAQESMVYSLVYLSNSKYIVSGLKNNIIKIWNADTFKEVATLIGHISSVTSVFSSPDGKYIVSGSKDSTVKIWDVENFKEVFTLKGHIDVVVSVAYSPNGKYIASGSSDKTIKIWNANTFKEIATLIGHKSYVESVSYSPSSKYIVSGSKDSTIKIWDVENFKEIATLKGHENTVRTVAYSPDSKYIVSGADDERIIIWDAENYKEVFTLKGHKDSVNSVAYSPNGKYIVSGADDGRIIIWDTEHFKKLITLNDNYQDIINSVAFSPDCKYIISASYDKTIKIWDIEKLNNLENPKHLNQNIKKLEQFLQVKLDGITLKNANIPPLSTKESYPKHHPFHWIDDAENGDAEAMYQLGLIYDRDNENQKALEWYKKASAKGHKEAKEQLEFLTKWLKTHSNANAS